MTVIEVYTCDEWDECPTAPHEHCHRDGCTATTTDPDYDGWELLTGAEESVPYCRQCYVNEYAEQRVPA